MRAGRRALSHGERGLLQPLHMRQRPAYHLHRIRPFGEGEVERGVVALKPLRLGGEQEEVPLAELPARIGARLGLD